MIEVKNLSKKFEVFQEKRNSLYDYVLKSNQYPKITIWALKNVSFNLKKGEVLGIIGKNGSGKSTLLKILASIVQPTEGNISIKGKILPLIELGIGFESELTGIENIHLHGSILGLTKEEINQKIKEVIDFADIGPFIHSKLKTYSSGMIARLAFSTVFMAEPDVLLIDEILSVGDEEFQKKSFAKISEFKKKGKTIILVSHNLDSIKTLCDTCILLEKGRILVRGHPNKVVRYYLEKNDIYSKSKTKDLEPKELKTKHENTKSEISLLQFELKKLKLELKKERIKPKRRLYNNDFQITSIKIPNNKSLFMGGKFEVEISYLAKKELKKPMFGVAIFNDRLIELTGPNTTFCKYTKESIKGKGKVKFIIDNMPLHPGIYYLSASLSDYGGKICYDFHELLYKFRIVSKQSKKYMFGLLDLKPKWEYY